MAGHSALKCVESIETIAIDLFVHPASSAPRLSFRTVWYSLGVAVEFAECPQAVNSVAMGRPTVPEPCVAAVRGRPGAPLVDSPVAVQTE